MQNGPRFCTARAWAADSLHHQEWAYLPKFSALDSTSSMRLVHLSGLTGQVECCGFLEQRQGKQLGLFADDSYFGGGDFEADESVAGVEVEKNFEIGGVGFQAFVGFSARGGCAGGFDGDRAGG